MCDARSFSDGVQYLVDVVERRLLRARPAAGEVGERLLECREETPRFRVSAGGDHIDADHGVGTGELRGRLEPRPVPARASISASGAKCEANAYGSPRCAHQLSAERARAENPERNVQPAPRDCLDHLSGPHGRQERL